MTLKTIIQIPTAEHVREELENLDADTVYICLINSGHVFISRYPPMNPDAVIAHWETYPRYEAILDIIGNPCFQEICIAYYLKRQSGKGEA